MVAQNMLPTLFTIFLVVGAGYSAAAQSVNPAIVGASHELTTPFNVAPGQLITLIVHLDPSSDIYQTVRAPAGSDLPSSLGGITGGYSQALGGASPPMAFLEIVPYWGSARPRDTSSTTLAAVTLQIPFEAICDVCGAGGVSQGIMSLFQGSAHGPLAYTHTFPDQVRILTTCDPIVLTGGLPTAMGLPCPSVVTHADGSAISATSPAQPGEEVVAWAVGLGQTNPPLQTGKLVTAPAPTQNTYLLDFNYRPNALSSKPLPGSPQPIYAGATPGYVGLYQVNFAIPSVPAGTPPCVDTSILPFGSNVVESNLTVSIGGQYSFDAARLCVAVPNQ